ncbi:MAG: SDR family oxidoreductase [Cyclobacteriaceae bacterium]
MKILLTGATGYIGKRLLPVLLEKGHHVVCCVRDKNRFIYSGPDLGKLEVIEADFLKAKTLSDFPADIDCAYYLIHSMSTSGDDFDVLESKAAQNFLTAIGKTDVRQVIYLSGIVNSKELSKHLSSRRNVEQILSKGSFNLTTLRAGIVVGSGSASFEIIRDLVEKLPIMITPRWLETKSQPIAIRNVIQYLIGVLNHDETFGNSYDIGGPDVLSYQQMLLRFAAIRKLKRWIMVVPVMTPKLSSYWLYFVTSTSYKLAVNLVNSMKIEIICQPNNLQKMLGIKAIPYDEAIKSAFINIEQNDIVSSWKDSFTSGDFDVQLSDYIRVPVFGCYKDARSASVENIKEAESKVWSIGGDEGWYYANWLWKLRGLMDKLVGGVGLRRGRTHKSYLNPGDALDFWRVLLADKRQKRLLLFAEMKLPGEAWLEFRIDDSNTLHQTATFRPKGVFGRLYWYAVMPLHSIIFGGMIKKIAGA